MPEVLLLADDLSGAAEAGAAFLLRTTRISVLLDWAAAAGPLPGHDGHEPRVVAIDLDTRRAARDELTARLTAVARAHPEAGAVVVKVDSLLRGNPGALLHAIKHSFCAGGADCADGAGCAGGAGSGATGRPRALPVVCTATPLLGRTVVRGVVHVGGVPLHETSLWHAEHATAPTSVADALAGVPTAQISLDLVRAGHDDLVAALRRAADQGLVPTCDATDDGDLDAVVGAATALSYGRTVLVGAGGLAAATARALAPEASPSHTAVAGDQQPTPRQVLVVVGSAAPPVAAEVGALAAAGATVVELDVAALLAGHGPALPRDAACIVVRLAPHAPVDPATSADLVSALAAIAAEGVGDRALVLTGGETARAVLDRLGIRRLRPVLSHHGAVASLSPGGRPVVTRPGSFGERAPLAELVSILSHIRTKERT